MTDSAEIMTRYQLQLAMALAAERPSNMIDFNAALRARADAAWWARADRLQARINRAMADRDDGGDAA